MEKIYYDPNGRKSFNIWVKNFALNLNDIWNEPSAKTLVPKDRNETSSIVIGRGPSLKAHNHLEKLANSNFSGTIICSDGILKNALESGVTPERFPNFYVLTIDPGDRIHRFFEDPIISKFGKKIKGIFSTIVDPKTLESARKSGIHISWLHSLVDYSEGKKSC